MDINNEKTAKSMLDLIKELIKQQLDSKDQVALCQIASPGSDGRYNIYVVPDDANVIHGIPNKFGFDLSTGDYVYVYKVGNQFAQSFIFAKVGENLDLREQLSRLEIEGGGMSSSGGSIQGSVVQGPRGEKGPKGDPGNSPYIGINGNWWVDNFDTGVQSLFSPSVSPVAPNSNSNHVWVDTKSMAVDAQEQPDESPSENAKTLTFSESDDSLTFGESDNDITFGEDGNGSVSFQEDGGKDAAEEVTFGESNDDITFGDK